MQYLLGQRYAEFCIAKHLFHPNIVEYLYFMRIYEPEKGLHKFHMILEKCNGVDLEKKLVQDKEPLQKIDQLKSIGQQIVDALKYLHNNQIIHQDLKPSNIIYDEKEDRAKLIDLGVSNRLVDQGATKRAGKCTYRYSSPEQLQGNLTFKTDVWAFGCVML